MPASPGASQSAPSLGCCLWLTGLPSSGKTTIGREVAERLRRLGRRVELLDGDEIRQGLSSDLGFDRAAREAHARRVTYVAKVLARNDVIAIVALISPYRSSRARARQEIERFVEIFVDTPLSVCEERDVKGLYRKARAGEITGMTGIDDPYEPPERPEITLATLGRAPADSAEELLSELRRLGWLPEPGGATPSAGRDRERPRSLP